MAQKSSILIVERSGEVRNVLGTVLQRRGFAIYEASRADEGLKLARQHQPDLIVIDVDEPSTEAISPELCRASGTEATPLIMLGTLRRSAASGGQFIAKPYHYQPLISRIERILQARVKPGSRFDS